MPERLSWDDAGTRRYEFGVDHGVLYLPDGTAVPWNGLTSVDESAAGAEIEPLYFEGQKYIDVKTPGEFSATLKAFTYPDEFMQFDGYAQLESGLILDGQPVQDTFSLSYRTSVGNDVDGNSAGYRIHLVYNLTASPETSNRVTAGESTTPSEFSWTLTGVPERVVGRKPSVHAVIDSTKLHRGLMRDLEDILYGGESEARLPPLQEIATFMSGWSAFVITKGVDGSFTISSEWDDISINQQGVFEIQNFPGVYLDDDTYQFNTTV